MKRQSGFTLLEILVVVAIMGILSATAVPLYHTWLGRARGSEATIMLKQIISAEISYLLDNSKFYPDNTTYMILDEGETTPQDAIKNIEDNLHLSINQGHDLEYSLTGNNEPENENFILIISSKGGKFDIFKDTPELIVRMDKNGTVDQFTPYY
jgi:prepilin-type N-terminal cleavage/methylation domain-containing protein